MHHVRCKAVLRNSRYASSPALDVTTYIHGLFASFINHGMIANAEPRRVVLLRKHAALESESSLAALFYYYCIHSISERHEFARGVPADW